MSDVARPDPAGAPLAGAEDEDAARLAALGYTSEFKRDMGLWANFSLGFTYLSPVVGIYTAFAVALAAGGPPMIWSLVVAGVGQMMVALVFSEIVSQFPVAGGVYPWARRLWGRRWSWMTSWVYILALLSTISVVVYGAGPYIGALFGFTPTVWTTITCALALLLVATLLNFAGTKVLSFVAIFGFVAELVGAVAVAAWLFIAHREHGLGVLFDSFGAGGEGSYLAAFFAASLIGTFQYYGFEACGDVAEEVQNPGRLIPQSMRRTIYIGGGAAITVCLGLILAVTDFAAVISGEDVDPVNTILVGAFGEVGARVVLAIVLISFVSCALSLQAAASRLLYAFGRDRMIPGGRALAIFSQRLHVPPVALLVAAVVPAAVILASSVIENALTKIISFSTVGIYLAFQLVVLAALRARMLGWQPSGPYQLGRWGTPVNVIALVWGVGAIVNICWPRTPDAPWYDNYVVVLSALVVVGVGVIYLFVARPDERSDTPYGDAIPRTSASSMTSATRA